MSTRGKRIVTYKRDPERQKRQRIKKALGVSTWDDVARLAATPAISLRDRPSLQVAQFTWTQNKVPVVFNPGGTVYLMTMYPFGGSEAQRHANTTMTYKMSIGQEVQLDKAFYASCGMYYMQWWLVYDKASTAEIIQQMLITLLTPFNLLFLAVAPEHHQDGSLHFHVLFQCARRIITRRVDFFDLNNYHPNIQPARDSAAVLEYISKEQPPIVWGEFQNHKVSPSRRDDRWRDIIFTSSSDSRLQKLVTVIVVTLLFVGIVYLAYVLFLKDVILLLKAKRQRTTTEIGFGQTPRVNTQGGGVG
nr:coat protein [Ipomoea batatas]